MSEESRQSYTRSHRVSPPVHVSSHARATVLLSFLSLSLSANPSSLTHSRPAATYPCTTLLLLMCADARTHCTPSTLRASSRSPAPTQSLDEPVAGAALTSLASLSHFHSRRGRDDTRAAHAHTVCASHSPLTPAACILQTSFPPLVHAKTVLRLNTSWTGGSWEEMEGGSSYRWWGYACTETHDFPKIYRPSS